MSKASEIAKWQNDLQAAPKVWLVHCEGEYENTGNAYDSKEAAELECEFIRKHRPRQRPTIHCINVHSQDLSRRRWSGFQP